MGRLSNTCAAELQWSIRYHWTRSLYVNGTAFNRAVRGLLRNSGAPIRTRAAAADVSVRRALVVDQLSRAWSRKHTTHGCTYARRAPRVGDAAAGSGQMCRWEMSELSVMAWRAVKRQAMCTEVGWRLRRQLSRDYLSTVGALLVLRFCCAMADSGEVQYGARVGALNLSALASVAAMEARVQELRGFVVPEVRVPGAWPAAAQRHDWGGGDAFGGGTDVGDGLDVFGGGDGDASSGGDGDVFGGGDGLDVFGCGDGDASSGGDGDAFGVGDGGGAAAGGAASSVGGNGVAGGLPGDQARARRSRLGVPRSSSLLVASGGEATPYVHAIVGGNLPMHVVGVELVGRGESRRCIAYVALPRISDTAVMSVSDVHPTVLRLSVALTDEGLAQGDSLSVPVTRLHDAHGDMPFLEQVMRELEPWLFEGLSKALEEVAGPLPRVAEAEPTTIFADGPHGRVLFVRADVLRTRALWGRVRSGAGIIAHQLGPLLESVMSPPDGRGAPRFFVAVLGSYAYGLKVMVVKTRGAGRPRQGASFAVVRISGNRRMMCRRCILGHGGGDGCAPDRRGVRPESARAAPQAAPQAAAFKAAGFPLRMICTHIAILLSVAPVDVIVGLLPDSQPAARGGRVAVSLSRQRDGRWVMRHQVADGDWNVTHQYTRQPPHPDSQFGVRRVTKVVNIFFAMVMTNSDRTNVPVQAANLRIHLHASLETGLPLITKETDQLPVVAQTFLKETSVQCGQRTVTLDVLVRGCLQARVEDVEEYVRGHPGLDIAASKWQPQPIEVLLHTPDGAVRLSVEDWVCGDHVVYADLSGLDVTRTKINEAFCNTLAMGLFHVRGITGTGHTTAVSLGRWRDALSRMAYEGRPGERQLGRPSEDSFQLFLRTVMCNVLSTWGRPSLEANHCLLCGQSPPALVGDGSSRAVSAKRLNIHQSVESMLVTPFVEERILQHVTKPMRAAIVDALAALRAEPPTPAVRVKLEGVVSKYADAARAILQRIAHGMRRPSTLAMKRWARNLAEEAVLKSAGIAMSAASIERFVRGRALQCARRRMLEDDPRTSVHVDMFRKYVQIPTRVTRDCINFVNLEGLIDDTESACVDQPHLRVIVDVLKVYALLRGRGGDPTPACSLMVAPVEDDQVYVAISDAGRHLCCILAEWLRLNVSATRIFGVLHVFLRSQLLLSQGMEDTDVSGDVPPTFRAAPRVWRMLQVSAQATTCVWDAPRLFLDAVHLCALKAYEAQRTYPLPEAVPNDPCASGCQFEYAGHGNQLAYLVVPRGAEACVGDHCSKPSLLRDAAVARNQRGVVMEYNCPHGVCYGFRVVMRESPYDPLILPCFMSTMPSVLGHDCACMLAEGISRSKQGAYNCTAPYMDRFHGQNHRCSKVLSMPGTGPYASINSSVTEGSWSAQRGVSSTMGACTLDSFMLRNTFMHSMRNRAKRIQQQQQRSVHRPQLPAHNPFDVSLSAVEKEELLVCAPRCHRLLEGPPPSEELPVRDAELHAGVQDGSALLGSESAQGGSALLGSTNYGGPGSSSSDDDAGSSSDRAALQESSLLDSADDGDLGFSSSRDSVQGDDDGGGGQSDAEGRVLLARKRPLDVAGVSARKRRRRELAGGDGGAGMPVGVKNPSVLCFMISGLQCVAHSPAICAAVDQAAQASGGRCDALRALHNVTERLRVGRAAAADDVILDLEGSPEYEHLRPPARTWDGNSHFDAVEFLMPLLAAVGVADDTVSLNVCWSRQLVCTQCGCDSHLQTTETHTSLQVSLRRGNCTIQQLLATHMADEDVVGRCCNCREEGQVFHRSMAFLSAGAALCLHLLRFTAVRSCPAAVPELRRCSWRVDIGDGTLRVPIRTAAGDVVHIVHTYRLVAVVCHTGKFNRGHFVAHVLRGENTWYKCDDGHVRAVRGGIAGVREAVAPEAYLLFYERDEE